MTSNRSNVKKGRNKTKKNRAGKAISSSKNVKLNYHDKLLTCEVCGNNDYTENTGTFGKSKLRSGVGQIFFGDAADVLDTTSVIIYTCNTCGLCRIIRNKDPISITAKPL